MKRVLAALIFITLIMISGCEEDFATNSTGGKVDTLYLGTKDTVYKVDTIKTITVIEEVDTIIKVTIDSIIKVDTITTLTYDTLHIVDTLFIDTGYHIDTLYITDTTKYDNDTIYAGKTVFAMGMKFVTENSYEFSIRTNSFSGEIPTLVQPTGEFTLNAEGAISFIDTIDFNSAASTRPYKIIMGEDTLSGTVALSDYIIDSLTVNDTTFYRHNNYSSDPWNDAVWRIEYDFKDTNIAISWDNDTQVVREFSGNNEHRPEWLDYRVYDLTGATHEKTEENQVSFRMVDPMIEKITGTFRTKTGSIQGMKPHASSKTMESYLIVHESINKVEIYKPREWMDGLFYIGPNGWTEFDDSSSSPLTLTMSNDEDTLHSITINKNGAGYGIAHGRVGDEDSLTTMRKLKQIYIHYRVGDDNDTVSLGLTAGIKTSTDETTWSTFRAVLTSALNSSSYYETAILDLSDFYISWDDENFPVGTTLADVIASDYRETINSITIAPEDPNDTNFEMRINTLYFAGDYGFRGEAVKDDNWKNK